MSALDRVAVKAAIISMASIRLLRKLGKHNSVVNSVILFGCSLQAARPARELATTACLPTRLPSRLPTRLPVRLPALLQARLLDLLPTRLPTLLQTRLPTHLSAYLSVYRPALLPSYRPAYLLVCTRLVLRLPLTRLPICRHFTHLLAKVAYQILLHSTRTPACYSACLSPQLPTSPPTAC